MAHPPNRTYVYPHQQQQQQQQNTPNAASAYYYEDTEGYGGDYSESDDGSHQPVAPQNAKELTELYRRKPQIQQQQQQPKEAQYQDLYANAEYYYPVSVAGAAGAAVAGPKAPQRQVPQRARVPVNEMAAYYQPERISGEFGNVLYRSTPHILERPVSPPRVPSGTVLKPVGVKRPPVAFRTTKYYRPVSAVYKRPSTLCLPVACQPDPANIGRRVRKPPQSRVYEQIPHPISPPMNAATRRQSTHFDKKSIRQQTEEAEYEKYAAGEENQPQEILQKAAKYARMLKPKVPQSIKEQQDELRRARSKNPLKEKLRNDLFANPANMLEVEELSTDALRTLLSDLQSNGFADQLANESPERDEDLPKKSCDYASGDRAMEPNLHHETSKKQATTSYNYTEIAEGLKNAKDDPLTEEDRRINLLNTPNVSLKKPTQSSRQIPRVLVSDALELHKTKSYVVNLIDQALSTHLGTTSSEKYAPKDSISNLDPKTAIELLRNHAALKKDKDLCLEIAQVLTNSFTSNTSAQSVDSKVVESSCSCGKNEEPLYIKQLKQLRWGHFRQIQREIRRLEDLEKFLDSCECNDEP